MLIDAADAVPASPLNEAIGAVYIDPLLTVPVEWPRVSLELFVRAELVSRWQNKALKRNGA